MSVARISHLTFLSVVFICVFSLLQIYLAKLQIYAKANHVFFCLGAIVCVKILENRAAIKIFHVSDIKCQRVILEI